MSSEKRRHVRLAKPLDGSWTGASGGAICRIADISWSGCFISTLAEPAKGERTAVTLALGNGHLTIDGRVAYVDNPQGFAVEFDPLTSVQIEALRVILGDPPTSV